MHQPWTRRILTGLIFFFIFIVFASEAFAGIYFEPFVGYSVSGTAEQDTTLLGVTTTAESKFGNLGYGAKLGFMANQFFIAGSYGMGSFDLEAEGTINTQDIDMTEMAALIGFSIPQLFKIWGGYVIQSSWEYQSGPSANSTLKGSGFFVGVGKQILPYLQLNVEYKMLSYDELEDSSGTTIKYPIDLGLAKVEELETSEIFVGISFPINF